MMINYVIIVIIVTNNSSIEWDSELTYNVHLSSAVNDSSLRCKTLREGAFLFYPNFEDEYPRHMPIITSRQLVTKLNDVTFPSACLLPNDDATNNEITTTEKVGDLFGKGPGSHTKGPTDNFIQSIIGDVMFGRIISKVREKKLAIFTCRQAYYVILN